MSDSAIQKIPNLPGVYIFKNHDGAVIYVGKAKDLRKRVSSYFHDKDDWKVQELIREHVTVDFVVTKNETEALLLEAQLVRDYQPKYNTLLKNGNPYLYLLFTQGELPELKLVRTKKEKGIYFGPFLHKRDARGVYDYLLRTFKLKTCTASIEQGCLEYHLGRCAGTCMKNFDTKEYLTRLELAQAALAGNHEQYKKTVTEQIKHHNQELAFEKAAHLVGYLKNLEVIFETIKTRFTEQKYVHDVASKLAPFKRTAEERAQALEELKELLRLEKTPITIDCFDISHFQSRYIVGSCVRFTNGAPDKQKYRRFKIRSLVQQNDYAALQEIVMRRYKAGDFPDLIIIDGGKGQLNAVKDLVGATPIISLAKREETIFSDTFPDGIKLDIQHPGAQIVIALRDYAHHCAILYHKHIRGKEYHESGKIHHRIPRTDQ